MKLNYNVKGPKRKSLVAVISQTLNAPTKYLGAPTFAYEIGDYQVDKTGTLTGPDNLDLEDALYRAGFEAEGDSRHYDEPDTYESGLGDMDALRLLEDYQRESGIPESYTYQAELSDPDYPDRMEIFGAVNDEDALRQAYELCEGEVVLLELFQLDENYNNIRSVEITPRTDRLTLEIPLDGFTPEKLDNLSKLVTAKATLLKAALGTNELPIEQAADTLRFPWFRGEIDSEHAEAYSSLVSLLCKTAIEKKRITAKEKDDIDNPKYAMRCFLLSLGFIGDKYKSARRILLKNLSGNSSFKTTKSEVIGDE